MRKKGRWKEKYMNTRPDPTGFSFKPVLPALVPELGYDKMEIRNGEMAGQAYSRMNKSSDAKEVEQIRTALHEYCRLDTFAMVKLLEALKGFLR